MEGAEVLELGQLGGLNNAGQGTASGTEDPGAGQGPEGIKAGPSEAGLEGEQEWSKGTDQEIGHEGALSFIFKKGKTRSTKKRPYGLWRLRSLNNSRFTCAICFS